MSDDSAAIADAFDRERDPLAAHEGTFESLDVDPLSVFVDEVLTERDLTESTRSTYESALRQWRTYMTEAGRHPACPAPTHVAGFIEYLEDERGNVPSTIKQKLSRLHEAYSFWQSAPEYPHSADFDPIATVMDRTTFEEREQKSPPPLTLGELGAVLESIMNLRDRLIVLMQLKLGLRASELCNIKLSEINVSVDGLDRGYDRLGTHSILEGRQNAVFIPHDRQRNKSGNPRVLPLDEETRSLLARYLRVRPDADNSWLLLSKNRHAKLDHQDVQSVWEAAFQPMYSETKHHRSVTSHFGRHFFSTFWRVEQDLSRPRLKYMRGDVPGTDSIEDQAGIDWYIHTYYEDIEPLYRDSIYKFWN